MNLSSDEEEQRLRDLTAADPQIKEFAAGVRGTEKLLRSLNAPGANEKSWGELQSKMSRRKVSSLRKRILLYAGSAAAIIVAGIFIYTGLHYNVLEMAVNPIEHITAGTSKARLPRQIRRKCDGSHPRR